MSDKAVPFFSPTDVLSLGGTWAVQENSLSESNQRAQGLDAVGDEAAGQTYDNKTAGTIVYEDHSAAGGTLTLPAVGSVAGGYHIDSLSLAYNATGWPRLTVTVHKHADNSHADGDMNEYSATPVFPTGFGIPRELEDALEASLFSITDDDAGLRSMTYTLGATHVDENDEAGDHLAGQTRDGVETLAVEFTKIPAVVTIAAGWDEMTDGSNKSNTAAETASMSWEHHVARDA
jgi:hypothetical protein